MDDVVGILVELGIRKALDISLSMSVTRSHADLELLVSHWSTHTSVSSWGEFTWTMYDVQVMFHLLLFADNGARGIFFFG